MYKQKPNISLQRKTKFATIFNHIFSAIHLRNGFQTLFLFGSWPDSKRTFLPSRKLLLEKKYFGVGWDRNLWAPTPSRMYCFIFHSSAGLLFWFKGCGKGTVFVLVSPCFRENVVVTCKIGSFLCSIDNLHQKNVIVFFFGNQISKWRSFEKSAIFDLLFTFFSHQGRVTKIPSSHISHTSIHVFCSFHWLFLPYQFWKKYKFIRYGFSLVWVLVLILIRTILEQSINNKTVSKI